MTPPQNLLGVLIVDNDPLMHATYRVLLASDAHRLEIATTADDAISKMKSQLDTIDVAIVDYKLNETQTGDRVVRDLRGIKPGMGIVVVTGLNDLKVRESCTKAGADAFVIKGSDVMLLPEILKQLCSRH